MSVKATIIECDHFHLWEDTSSPVGNRELVLDMRDGSRIRLSKWAAQMLFTRDMVDVAESL